MGYDPIQGWWLTAKAGDKVVCIRGDWPPSVRHGYRHEVVQGQVYTIKSVYPQSMALCGVALELVGCFHAYSAHGFRPVTKKSTEAGMAILRSILNTSPANIGENV